MASRAWHPLPSFLPSFLPSPVKVRECQLISPDARPAHTEPLLLIDKSESNAWPRCKRVSGSKRLWCTCARLVQKAYISQGWIAGISQALRTFRPASLPITSTAFDPAARSLPPVLIFLDTQCAVFSQQLRSKVVLYTRNSPDSVSYSRLSPGKQAAAADCMRPLELELLLVRLS